MGAMSFVFRCFSNGGYCRHTALEAVWLQHTIMWWLWQCCRVPDVGVVELLTMLPLLLLQVFIKGKFRVGA